MPRTLATLTLLLTCAAALRAEDELEAQMKSVLDAFALVERNAADHVSARDAFYQGAIPGLLRNLDPHSVFFNSDQLEQLRKLETSTEKGFGSVVSLLPGRVIVLQTVAGTPSAKAGLSPGDEILTLNGYIVARLEVEQLTQLLGAARQREAHIEVRRPGSARILQFTLTPEEIKSPSVDRMFFVGAGIGYIRIATFEEGTSRELKAAIEKLGGKRLGGLVLDLRNNPGGLMAAALQVASLFLPPETKIMTVRGRNVAERPETVPADADPYAFKLAVLINERSASSSEIVAGAMQDHDRAMVIGQPSFGKGLVQSVFPMSEGTAVALTTAFYYTPSGRSIQKPLDAERFALGGTTARPTEKTEFRTDKGRPVTGGGGIQPDQIVYPAPTNRLRAVLDASGAFPDFAAEYLLKNKITPDFEAPPELIDRFRVYLSQRRIQPGQTEWSAEGEFIRSRLTIELLNQAFGVEKGDEVEARRDPVVLKAVEIVGA